MPSAPRRGHGLRAPSRSSAGSAWSLSAGGSGLRSASKALPENLSFLYRGGRQKASAFMRISKLGLALAALAASGVAFAHHSFAMFDRDKEVVLTGTIHEFQWTNPHAFI